MSAPDHHLAMAQRLAARHEAEAPLYARLAGDDEPMATPDELAAALRAQQEHATERDSAIVRRAAERRPPDDPDSRRFVVRVDAWMPDCELESWQVEGLLSAGMETFGLDTRDFLVEVEEVLA